MTWMDRLNHSFNGLGNHPGFPLGSFSRQEIAAGLARAGHAADYLVVPELEGPCGAIDLAWCARLPEPKGGSLFSVHAAFELEGQFCTTKSARKDVANFREAKDRGSQVGVLLLFSVGDDGRPWLTKPEARSNDNAISRLRGEAERNAVRVRRDVVAAGGSAPTIHVLSDHEMLEKLAAILAERLAM